MLVMNVEYVMQVPHKVVVFTGIIECDKIKPGEDVDILSDGNTITAKIMCIETFMKTHAEAVKGQNVALVFRPTKELRSIKGSYTGEIKNGKYVFEKSDVIIKRGKT